MTHDGDSNTGSNVPVTCTISHAPTRYKPAMRMKISVGAMPCVNGY